MDNMVERHQPGQALFLQEEIVDQKTAQGDERVAGSFLEPKTYQRKTKQDRII
jgi:hypothetical protein